LSSLSLPLLDSFRNVRKKRYWRPCQKRWMRQWRMSNSIHLSRFQKQRTEIWRIGNILKGSKFFWNNAAVASIPTDLFYGFTDINSVKHLSRYANTCLFVPTIYWVGGGYKPPAKVATSKQNDREKRDDLPISNDSRKNRFFAKACPVSPSHAVWPRPSLRACGKFCEIAISNGWIVFWCITVCSEGFVHTRHVGPYLVKGVL